MAGAGSGNLQGVTYTRLSHQHNPLTDFSLAGYGYATDHYQRLVASSALKEGLDIGLGGYLQLHDSDDILEHLTAVLPLAPDFARVLSATEIAAQIGLEPRCGGIHYLRGGWLNPHAVCRALLDHPLISLREQCGNLSVQPSPDGLWQAQRSRRPLRGRSTRRDCRHRTARHATIRSGVAAAQYHSRANDASAQLVSVEYAAHRDL